MFCVVAVCVFAFVGKVPPLWGSIYVDCLLTQGSRLGLCRSIALSGLLADGSNSLSIICRSNYWAVSLFAFVVGLVGRCRCLRLLSDLLLGVVVCVCCRICWVVLLLAFVVGLARCRYLRLLSDLLVGVVTCACCWIDCSVWLFAFVVGFVGCAGVSAVGTTLLQSPGWNEGKARNATLG